MAYQPRPNLGQTTMSGSEPVVIASDQSTLPAGGNVAHDGVDSGNPIKIGGKASTSTPTPVSAADRVDAWLDEYGRQIVSDRDTELGLTTGLTNLRDRIVAQRYTILSDSVADGLANFWTTTTANGGTATSTGGEGVIQTSANATGSAQISSTAPAYYPGQVTWFNSAIRVGDTGSAGNVRRWGVFTVSGTTPQEGFYYELSGTTFNAVVVKSGTPTATAVASWTRATDAPFTLDTNYHSFEIRFTANTVNFYIDNVLRHTVSGTSAPITTTLNFPMTIHSVNSSGATNRLVAVRNCGIGRFGEQPTERSQRSTRTQQQTTITSSTTETTVLTAVAGTYLDVYGVIIANTSATACDVTFKDATSGTTRFNIYCPAGDTRGFMLPPEAAHNQAAVNANWTATCGTSVASIKITMFATRNSY